MPFYKIDPSTNRINLFFEDIPSYQTRNVLKANHWRWDPKEKCWYTHSNAATVQFAEAMCPGSNRISNHQQYETLGIFKKGTCGVSAYWMLSPLGQLMIAGNRKIDGYAYNQMDQSPWYTLRDQVKHLIIKDLLIKVKS